MRMWHQEYFVKSPITTRHVRTDSIFTAVSHARACVLPTKALGVWLARGLVVHPCGRMVREVVPAHAEHMQRHDAQHYILVR